MSTSTTCQRCGTLNAEWARFCAKCGNPLFTSPPSPPIPQAPPPLQPTVAPGPPPSWYSYAPTAAYEFQNRTAIDRTKTGLLLLLIGTLLGPVPYIMYIGAILAIIGAILVILGRKAFGSSHDRNTIWSLIIYIVGIIIGGVAGAIFGVELALAEISYRNGNGTMATLSQTLTSAVNTFLILLAIGGAVIGLAQVLFTYALQNRNGRIFLWTAFASSIAISIIKSLIVSGLVSDAVQRSFTGNTIDPTPLQNLQGQALLLGLLGIIPAALFSTALYLVWSRISRGELPAKTPAPPAPPSPMFSPPPPPTPPTTSPPAPPM